MNTTTSKMSLAAMLLLGLSAVGHAGEMTAAPGKAPEASVLSSIGAELSVGYDSRYYFRGLWFADDVLWGNIAYNHQFSDKLKGQVFGFYTDSASDLNYSEADFGVSLTYDAGPVDFSAGFTYYYFFNGFFGDGAGQSDASEFFVAATTSLAGLDFGLKFVQDVRIDASYIQADVSKCFTLSDRVSLVARGQLGIGLSEYYTFGADDDAVTHGLLRLELPVKLAENAILTPHVSYNISGDDFRSSSNAQFAEEDEVFGGVSLAVTF